MIKKSINNKISKYSHSYATKPSELSKRAHFQAETDYVLERKFIFIPDVNGSHKQCRNRYIFKFQSMFAIGDKPMNR